MKIQTTPVLFITLALVWLSLPAEAVSPPPDGGYPRLTTAEGDAALNALTNGLANTAVGWFSLSHTTAGSFNTAVGAGALDLNNGDENTATGVGALLLNTLGANNTANGAFALVHNNTGSDNTAVGDRALQNNTDGIQNTAIGSAALTENTGNYNTAVGYIALHSNTTGEVNSALGWGALHANTAGTQNTAMGVNALGANNSDDNTAVGYHALYLHTTGNNNNAFGTDALANGTSGAGNSAFGNEALAINTGDGNTAIGESAGSNLTTGSGNVCIGTDVFGVAGESDTTRIRNIGNTPLGSNIFVTVESVGGTKLGYQSSSARHKEQIEPMEQASESLYRLTPVTFRYKKELDPQGTQQYGLIAEDVAKVDPDLVVNDEEGKPATLRFLSIQAMMLNELLKEHAIVQELKREIAALHASLKEQAAQIQKVTSRLDVTEPTSRVIASKK